MMISAGAMVLDVTGNAAVAVASLIFVAACAAILIPLGVFVTHRKGRPYRPDWWKAPHAITLLTVTIVYMGLDVSRRATVLGVLAYISRGLGLAGACIAILLLVGSRLNARDKQAVEEGRLSKQRARTLEIGLLTAGIVLLVVMVGAFVGPPP